MLASRRAAEDAEVPVGERNRWEGSVPGGATLRGLRLSDAGRYPDGSEASRI